MSQRFFQCLPCLEFRFHKSFLPHEVHCEAQPDIYGPHWHFIFYCLREIEMLTEILFRFGIFCMGFQEIGLHSRFCHITKLEKSYIPPLFFRGETEGLSIICRLLCLIQFPHLYISFNKLFIYCRCGIYYQSVFQKIHGTIKIAYIPFHHCQMKEYARVMGSCFFGESQRLAQIFKGLFRPA